MRLLRNLLVAFLLVGCGGGEESLTPEEARQAAFEYAKDDIACTTDADCCTVADSCRAQHLLVAASDKERVAELLSKGRPDSCLACIMPAVQVSCQQGICRAAPVVSSPGADYDAVELNALQWSHCGSKPIPEGWSVPSSQGAASSWMLSVVTCEDAY